MWTRSLLKKNAWESLKTKNYYWSALGVSVLAALLCGSGGGGGSASVSDEEMAEMLGLEASNSETAAILLTVFIVLAVVFVAALAIGFAFTAFVSGPVEVGKCDYFYKARNNDIRFSNLFGQFNGSKYMPVVKVMFMRYLYTFLWTLLFIIPGIIKAYEYHLIPYLLAENPNLSKERAFEISRRTMDGEKWDLFVLQLSFIGWELLGALVCCGLGSYFVLPYTNATDAEFYACMRAKMIAQGIATEEELTGMPALPAGDADIY